MPRASPHRPKSETSCLPLPRWSRRRVEAPFAGFWQTLGGQCSGRSVLGGADAAERAVSRPAAGARSHPIGDLGAVALEAVDVAARAGGSGREVPAVVVVAVRDAVELQRAVTARADLPRAGGLAAVHADRDPLVAGAVREESPPRARQRAVQRARRRGRARG